MNAEMENFIKDLANRVNEGDKATIRNDHAVKYIDRLMEMVGRQEITRERVMDMLQSIKNTLVGV